MKTPTILLLVFFFGIAHSQITIKTKNIESLISQVYKEVGLTTPKTLVDSAKLMTTSYLLGQLSYQWEENNEYPVVYKIISINMDTLFELDDVKNQLKTVEDTNSVYYGTIKVYKESILKEKEYYLGGYMSKTEYEQNVKTYSEKIANELKSIDKRLKELKARINTLKGTEILRIITHHSVMINGEPKEYDVQYAKTKNGGWACVH